LQNELPSAVPAEFCKNLYYLISLVLNFPRNHTEFHIENYTIPTTKKLAYGYFPITARLNVLVLIGLRYKDKKASKEGEKPEKLFPF
jgi:hypothetical protein